MAWMPVDQNLTGHRKTLDLAKRQSWSPRYTAGVLIDVWGWAIDHCPHGYVDSPPGQLSLGTSLGTGDVAGEPVEGGGGVPRDHRDSLAKSLRMHRTDVAALLRHMALAGWIDKEGPTAGRFHEWDEWGGKIVTRREYEKEKKRKARNKTGPSEAMSPGTDLDTPAGQRLVQEVANRLGQNGSVPRDSTTLSPGMSRTKTRQEETRQESPSPGTQGQSYARGTTGQGGGGSRALTVEEQRRSSEERADEILESATGPWRMVLEGLRDNARDKQQLGNFVTWYAGTRLEVRGDTSYVVTTNAFSRDWLRGHYMPALQGAIGAITGTMGPDVRVVLEDELPIEEAQP